MKFQPSYLDHWWSTDGNIIKYDKVEHAIRDCVIFLLASIWLDLWAILVSVLFNIVYEIYNGIVPYDGEHIQGFSWKDLYAGLLGVCFGLIIYGVIINVTL